MKKYAAVCLGLFLIFSLFVTLPYVLQSPSDKPVPADAIVILGGGGVERLLEAFNLCQEGYATKFILPGADDGVAISKLGTLDSRAKWLMLNGIPADNIFIVDRSHNSWLEAQRTLEVMRQHHWKKVIVVSDPPHLLRLAYAWGKTFYGQPQNYLLVPTKPKWWVPWKWWKNEVSSNFIHNEVLKLGYYVVTY